MVQVYVWQCPVGPNVCADSVDRADRPFFRICNKTCFVGGTVEMESAPPRAAYVTKIEPGAQDELTVTESSWE